MKPQLYPLNDAEAIFAPFHDPLLRRSFRWKFVPAKDGDGTLADTWCGVQLSWASSTPGSWVGEVVVPLSLPSIGRWYDRFVFCLAISSGASATFTYLDAKKRWLPLGPARQGTGSRMEIVQQIPRHSVHGLRLRIASGRVKQGVALLSWFGMQRADAIANLVSRRVGFAAKWTGLIKPEKAWGDEKFRIGLILGSNDLPSLRQKKRDPRWRPAFAALQTRAEQALTRTPENDLRQSLPWSDPRFQRARDRGPEPLCFDALVLGLVGMINRDRRMIRHALRYAMVIAHTPTWLTSEECALPGSTWDQRCFLEELHTTTLALLMDWFDSALTDRARELLAQSIWDKGLARIERDMAKFEYLYHCNQGPWFCRARILGGLILESIWPRLNGYVDRAAADLQEGLRNTILPDGSCNEGPLYLAVTLETALVGLTAYSRSRQRNLRDLLPPRVRKCVDYFAAISSSKPGKIIPLNDCPTDRLKLDVFAMLAAIFPEQAYSRFAAASLPDRSTIADGANYIGKGVFSYLLGPSRLPASSSIVQGFTHLRSIGIISCRRASHGRSLRLAVIGTRSTMEASASGHRHRDVGAVLTEIDDVPLFIDRGIVRYNDPRYLLMKPTQMHNVLTPILSDEQSPQQAEQTVPHSPAAEGNTQTFRAKINLENVWREHMSGCRRTVESKSIEEWVVSDLVALKRPGSVNFHLHALHPFQTKAGLIYGSCAAGRVEIRAPWAVSVSHREDGIDCNYQPVYHLELRSAVAANHALLTEFRRVE